MSEPVAGVRIPPAAAIALAVAVAAAIAVTAYVVLRPGDGRSVAPGPTPVRGTACANLRAAADAYAADDAGGFQAAVDEAARLADRALERSGEDFGAPEQVALELQAATRRDPVPAGRVESLLDRAQTVCAQAGRWDP